MLGKAYSGLIIKVLALVGVVLSLTRCIGLDLEWVSAEFYYLLWTALALLTIERKNHFSVAHILFLLVSLFSILLNNVEAVFQSEYRLLSFLIMLWAIGGLSISQRNISFRVYFFKYLNVSLVILTIVSFCLYPLGISLLSHSNGLYKGLFNHSMLLGPIAGISTILSIFNCLYPQKIFKIHPRLSVVVAVISTLTLLLSGSRGALGAVLVGIMILLYIRYGAQKIKLLKILLSLIIGLLVSGPIWYPYTEQIRFKQERNLRSGGTFQSRERLWEDRWAEFNNSPIIGSGFASMNKELVKQKLTNNAKGGVEPGSSWLFLLSSTGLLGFLCFFYMGVMPCLKIIKTQTSRLAPLPILLISMLAMMFVHMFLEGYVVSSGAFLFLYLWLCIGLMNNSNLTLKNFHP